MDYLSAELGPCAPFSYSGVDTFGFGDEFDDFLRLDSEVKSVQFN